MRTTTVVLWTLAALVVGVLVWGIDRGFCVSDEGFYLAETVETSRMSQFGVVTRAICLGSGVTVIGSRVARLVVTLVAAAAFGAGWSRWARAVLSGAAAEWLRPARTVPLMCIAATMGWGYYPQSLSYNTVTAAGCLLAGAGALCVLAASAGPGGGGPAGEFRRADAWALALGAACAVWVLPVKAPTSVLLVAGLAAVVAFPRSGVLRAAAPWLLCGIAAGVASVWIAACSPAEWYEGVLRVAASLRGTNHGAAAILTVQAHGVRDMLRSAAALHGPAVAALALAAFVARRSDSAPESGLRRLTVGALVLAALAIELARADVRAAVADVRSSLGLHLLVAVAAVLLVVATPSAARPDVRLPASRDRRFVLGCAVLFSLPLAGMLGTDVPIDAWFLQYGAPWVALLVTGIATAASRRTSVACFAALAVAVAGVESAQTLRGFVLLPFRVGPSDRGLLDQTEPVAEPRRLHGLRLTSDQVQFFAALDAATAAAGAPPPGVIALHDMPGVVYALGLPATGCSWLFRGKASFNAAVLRAEPESKLRGSWVLVNTKRAPGAAEFLRELGLPFPDGYRRVVAVPDAYNGGETELWCPAP